MTYKVNLRFENKKDLNIDLEFTTKSIESMVPQICQMELKRREMQRHEGNVKYHRSYTVDNHGVVNIQG